MARPVRQNTQAKAGASKLFGGNTNPMHLLDVRQALKCF
jgi:hypothetical protein